MKTLILAAAMTAATLAQAAQPGDTLTVNNAKKVTVVSSDSLLRVTVDGTDTKPDYHYETALRNNGDNYESSTVGSLFNFSLSGKINKNCRRKATYDSELHAFFGFNGATGNSDQVKTNQWGGFNSGIYIDWGVHPWRNAHRFSVGFGVEWKNYRMNTRRQFVKNDNGVVTVEPLGNDIDPKFSRIKTFSLIFPILYTYEKHGWGFSAGAIIDYTTHSTIKTRYSVNGKKYKQTYKNLHHNGCTVDLMATFINPLVDIYVKYNPCEILNTEYGPKFHSLSLGFML